VTNYQAVVPESRYSESPSVKSEVDERLAVDPEVLKRLARNKPGTLSTRECCDPGRVVAAGTPYLQAASVEQFGRGIEDPYFVGIDVRAALGYGG
jgi:hypothetical protein